MFQIGFMIFEWGQSRIKNADSSVLKHLFLLMSSSLITFAGGFALAFGDPHLIGTKYFLSYEMLKTKFKATNDEVLALHYLTMILTMSICSSVAVSSLNER